MILTRCRRMLWTVSAGMVLAAGCTNVPRPGSTAISMDNEKTKPLKPAQVTDMQFTMAQMADKRGELSQASAAYQEVLKKEQKRAEAWMRLAIVNYKQGKFAESMEQYRQVQAMQPNNVELYCNLGYSYCLQERWP